MGILERLGWKRRAPRPVGDQLETGGRDESEGPSLRFWLLRGGLFLGLVVLTVAAFPRGEVYEYAVQVGEPWQRSTLEAPFDFPIYAPEEKVEAQRDSVRRNTPPFFRPLPNPRRTLAANRDTLARQLDRALSAYASYQYHRAQGQPQEARTDSLRYVRARRNALATLSASQWNLLAQQYAREVQGLSETARGAPSPQSERLDRRLLEDAFQLGTQLLSVGVIDQPLDSVTTDIIVVRNPDESTQRTVEKKNLYGLNQAYRSVENQLQQKYSTNPRYADIAFAFFRAIFQPSLRYMRAETLRERAERARNITAIQGGVKKGEVIVRQGQRVTPEIKQKLTSLEKERNDGNARSILGRQVLGQSLLAILGFTFFFAYLLLLRPNVWAEERDMVLLTVVLGFVLALLGIAVRIDWIELYAVPVALASVLLTIVFNSRIGLFATLVLAFTGGQMLGLDLEYALATFFSGAFGVFSVRDIKNRGQFFVSAGLVFLGYVVVLTASWLYLGTPTARLGNDLIFAAIGSSFTITASLFLWALERAFDITTDLTLLELSDTNNKLLKELSLRAPGSFNHSLQVANLAEAAADRIDAHALLTRVGALYHDIGKMLKPEYFVENQRAGVNPHDRLKPRMSALIIASHVKEGLEMGKEHNLPERVLKFIPTHHGTARIEYFYRKALSRSDDANAGVLESEFRYPGPKPDSKETGILMLADSVEAASRSLDDPSHKRLKSLVDLIFRERINDGQLDDTDLTFRDLRLIKDTFLKMLLGIYHVRVKYPDQEEEREAEQQVLVAEEPDKTKFEDVTLALDNDPWPRRVQELDSLKTMAGQQDPHEPRPELAEASPHYKSDREGRGNGAVATVQDEDDPTLETKESSATPETREEGPTSDAQDQKKMSDQASDGDNS